MLRAQWQLVNDPRDYDKVKPSEKLRTFDLVLGDRYHMDKVINSLKEHIGRSSRLKSKGEAQGYTPKKVCMRRLGEGSTGMRSKAWTLERDHSVTARMGAGPAHPPPPRKSGVILCGYAHAHVQLPARKVRLSCREPTCRMLSTAINGPWNATTQ